MDGVATADGQPPASTVQIVNPQLAQLHAVQGVHGDQDDDEPVAVD